MNSLGTTPFLGLRTSLKSDLTNYQSIPAKTPEKDSTDAGTEKNAAREEETVTKILEDVVSDADSQSKSDEFPDDEEGDNGDELEDVRKDKFAQRNQVTHIPPRRIPRESLSSPLLRI